MTRSRPEVREQLLKGLGETPTGSARGATIGDLKHQLGLSNVSNTQFDAALGSLCYKEGQVRWLRVWPKDPAAQAREHFVALPVYPS